MAALVQGVQYGLSSQGNFHENKSLIFVKLTDSAYRAIEDFLRNKNKTIHQPTIQFLGNEGHLSFPSSESSHGYSGFNFTLSSTTDTEGPQGSFECIQQTGSNTREIKPGGPGIGRKVKVKTPLIPPKRDYEPANTHLSPLKKGYPPKPSSNGVIPSHYGNMNGNIVPSLAHTKPQGNNHAQKPGNPDIMRRPLRERLIHLLAVRPYKKIELFDRIIKDGLRDRDKNNLMNVLKQVACMKDNVFHLIRHVWNDVQEDWPFYTEQERQSLKRHKPQNLTPPGSSDGGSSGSGQSPTSTHPGSPPSTISSSSNMKRPGYFDGADGLQTKRLRISHYRKPEPPTTTSSPRYRLPDSSQQQRSTIADSSRSDDFYSRNARDRIKDAMKTNPRREYSGSRGSNGGGETLLRNNGYGSHHYNSSLVSSAMDGRCNDRPENEENDEKRSGNSAQRGYDSSALASKARCESVATNSSSGSGVCGVSKATNATTDNAGHTWNRTVENGNGVLSQSPSSRSHGGHHDNRNSRWTPRVTSTTQNNSASGSSPDSQLENLVTRREEENKETTSPESNSSDFRDYLLSYSAIRDNQQRKRYKEDFTADYKEYKDLHAEVERVSKRFAYLEERLRQAVRDSPGYVDIKNQIVHEYQENRQDLRFQEAKRRFQYLHDKLSHIKRLVLEYDSAVASGGNRY